jgi:hypothetical protein
MSLLALRQGPFGLRIQETPQVVIVTNIATATVPRDGTQDVIVQLERSGFSKPITVDVSNLPTGVTATWVPDNTFDAPPRSKTLQLASAENATLVSDYPVVLTAAADGTTLATLTLPVTVVESGGGSAVPFYQTSFETVASGDSPNNTGIVGVFTWDGGPRNRVYAITDSSVTQPAGFVSAPDGNQYLRFVYNELGTSDERKFSERRWRIPTENRRSKIWLEWELMIPTNWRIQSGSSTQQKVFWLGNENYTAVYVDPGRISIVGELWYVDSNTTRFRLLATRQNQNLVTQQASISNFIKYDGTGLTNLGAPATRIGVHAQVASSWDASDGVIELWINGTRQVNLTNFPLWPQQLQTLTSPPGFHRGYFWGYKNGGYLESLTGSYLMELGIDNVKVYDTDPQW